MIIFDIKRYAINDGPGIRTTIFMKGCPLRCVWCHNPESWLAEPEVLFKQSKCIGCNTCGLYPDNLPPDTISRYEVRDTRYEITNRCPAKALELCGREWTMDELMAEIEKERDVMEGSGGGVTLCGGEPLMHPNDTLLILKELRRRGFHRTVDTSLYASPEVVKAVAAETDLFLIDLKHMDSQRHRELTGVGNELILENIRMVASQQPSPSIWFRIPLIEGINADEENIEATARFIENLKTSSIKLQTSSVKHPPSNVIHLLPYHDIGKDKHHRRGTVYNPDGISMKEPSEATLTRCTRQFEAHKIKVVIGG